MGIVTFNNVCSLDYDIQVEHPPEYDTPERNYSVQSIPGRNGDLIQDNGSYKNVNRSYQIAIGSIEKEHPVMANDVSNWLHSGFGYSRLEDSYEPEYYRLAMYSESGNISNILNHAGRTTINFNCKPQRFLKSGDKTIIINKSGNLINPTNFTTLPIIVIKGTGVGSLQIGKYLVNILTITDGMTLNSEIQDIYHETTNLNSVIVLSDDEFPKLEAGTSYISFSGGITSIEIIPKWWTL